MDKIIQSYMGDFLESHEIAEKNLIDILSKISELMFVFVQAKTSSNFSSSEMGTFGAGLVDFSLRLHDFRELNACTI